MKLAGLVAVVALLGGCATSVSSDPLIETPAAAARGGELDNIALAAPCDRADDSKNLSGREEIAGFGATALISCVRDAREYPNEGEWSVLIRKVATDGLEELVAALQQSDDPPPPEGTACAAVGYGPLTVLLVDDAGHYLHPRAPTTACGAPQPEVMAALKAVEWRTVSVTRLEQTRSPESIDSDCEMGWKNELSYESSHLDPSDGGPVFPDRQPGSAVKVCLYRVTDDEPDAGTFTRAVMLDGADADQLMAAVTGPAPTQPCPAPADFAVFHVAHDWLNVELGGCWQVLRHDGVEMHPSTMRVLESIGTADPAELTRLLSLRQ